MMGQRDITRMTLGDLPTSGALNVRGEATAVEQQDDLSMVTQRVFHAPL